MRAGLVLSLALACSCQGAGPGPDAAPVAPVAAPGPSRTVLVGEPTTFDSSASSDADGEIVAVEWNFGDGSSSVDPVATKAFGAPGGYVVALTVTDDAGLTDRAEVVVTVTELELSADAVITPETVHAFEPATFDASGSVGPTDLVAWRWTFGDGTAAEGMVVEHAYDEAGSFSVLLEVEDVRGERAQLAGFVEVLPLDVGGTWDASAQSPTYSCSSYAAAFEDTELTFTLQTDGTLQASSQMGRTFTGTLEGNDFSLTSSYVAPTGGTCISAPVSASLFGTFTGTDAFSGTLVAYYDLAVPCQCSASFEVSGAKR